MVPMQPYWWQRPDSVADDLATLMRQIEALLTEQERLIAQLREERGRVCPTAVPDVQPSYSPQPPIIIKQASGLNWDTLATLGFIGWGLHSLLRGTPLPGNR